MLCYVCSDLAVDIITMAIESFMKLIYSIADILFLAFLARD